MNSEINWVLQIDNSIYKFCEKIPRADSRRIFDTIESLSMNPFFGDIQKMKGDKSAWRRRTGNYRIFYEVINDEHAIYVYKVKRRTSNTY